MQRLIDFDRAIPHRTRKRAVEKKKRERVLRVVRMAQRSRKGLAGAAHFEDALPFGNGIVGLVVRLQDGRRHRATLEVAPELQKVPFFAVGYGRVHDAAEGDAGITNLTQKRGWPRAYHRARRLLFDEEIERVDRLPCLAAEFGAHARRVLPRDVDAGDDRAVVLA